MLYCEWSWFCPWSDGRIHVFGFLIIIFWFCIIYRSIYLCTYYTYKCVYTYNSVVKIGVCIQCISTVQFLSLSLELVVRWVRLCAIVYMIVLCMCMYCVCWKCHFHTHMHSLVPWTCTVTPGLYIFILWIESINPQIISPTFKQWSLWVRAYMSHHTPSPWQLSAFISYQGGFYTSGWHSM